MNIYSVMGNARDGEGQSNPKGLSTISHQLDDQGIKFTAIYIDSDFLTEAYKLIYLLQADAQNLLTFARSLLDMSLSLELNLDAVASSQFDHVS